MEVQEELPRIFNEMQEINEQPRRKTQNQRVVKIKIV